MARQKDRPAVVTYDPPGGAAVTVPLRFPFRLDGRLIDVVEVLPPAYGDLRDLRMVELVGAEDILPAMTTLTVPAVLAMRWPDVEAVMTAALELLPADFAGGVRGGEAETETDPPPAMPEIASPNEDPGPMADFLFDPVRFDTDG